MPVYRVAGQLIHFSISIKELEKWKISDLGQDINADIDKTNLTLVCSLTGLVGGEMRRVEVLAGAFGFLLKVAGGGDVCISPDGKTILSAEKTSDNPELDHEIILGPALVLALALSNTWCLHCSAVLFRGRLFVFLGESGQGKSTLAGYLSGSESRAWLRMADDILPMNMDSGLQAWSNFPQLKLPPQSWSDPSLPEKVQVKRAYLLKNNIMEKAPEIKLIPRGKAVQSLIRHTAGARLFDRRLLAGHLAFVKQMAELVSVHELVYPRSISALAEVRELLETQC